MSLTVEQWHQQFLRQASWTHSLRTHLYDGAALGRAEAVLDVGCGTGAITGELSNYTGGVVTGLDLDPAVISFAACSYPRVQWILGDAHRLPFEPETFDVVLCNFVLLWTEHPGVVVQEMARVVRRGGKVLATTEPDYGGRIDYPEEIALGPLMEQSLRRDGAEPRIGRRLKALFAAAGLQVDCGVIASMWDNRQLADEFDAEWDFIFRTLSNVAGEGQLRAYRDSARKAVREGARLVFMPNFWAMGTRPLAGSV